MGSSPSTGQKTLVGVEEINTPETQSKQNQEFKSSVQQMKVTFLRAQFSKRDDIFKEKSDEAKMEIKNALQNLKKNQLLSTSEFKKLHNTEQLINDRLDKRKSTIKAQRYEYKPKGNKYSEQSLAIKKNKQQSIKEISSGSSTYINEGKDINDVSTSKTFQLSRQALVIGHLLNRKRNTNSQNSSQNYRNVFDHNGSQDIKDPQMKYENGKSNQGKKRSKYIKSQKFIPHQLTQLDEDAVPQYSFQKQSR